MESSTGQPISGITTRLIDVLLVEHDTDARARLTKLLETNECLVRSASTLRDAADALVERMPDVVISDLRLGDSTTGWMFAEHARNQLHTKHVAHIAVTSRLAPRFEIVRLFDAFLPKPVDQVVLLELVRQLTAIARGMRRRHAV